MTGWNTEPDADKPRGPFTVLVSVGRPTTFEPSADPGIGEQQYEEPPARHWMWQQSVCTVLHAVFIRGGSIAAPADDQEFLALFWGVAQVYADELLAGHVDPARGWPLYILQEDADQPSSTGDEASFIAAFEQTGLVEVHHWTPDHPLPGPPPHFGLVLWPDDSTDTQLLPLEGTDSLVEVRWKDRGVEYDFEIKYPRTGDVIQGKTLDLLYELEKVVNNRFDASAD